MNKKDQHLVLIDGYGFVFRAFHAFPPLKNANGEHVGAIYGFTSMLTRVILEISCSHFAVVLDSGGKTFRHDIFPEYKSHRPPVPEELITQFPLVREAVSALNVDILEKQGFEADDLIATFAKAASNKGIKVTIISSDKDLMQLIDDNISLYDPLKSKYINAPEVKEKFGVRPDQIIDILALIGDSADFVPGVPGIGPKTASDLLNTYDSLDGVYENIDKLATSKRKQSLIDNKDLAYLSQKLVILNDQVPMNIGLDDLKIKISHVEQFKDFLKKHSFNSLYNKAEKICNSFYNNNIHNHDSIRSTKIIEITDATGLKEWLDKRTSNSGQLSIIMEAGFLCLACDSSEIAICTINNSSSLGLFQKNNELTIAIASKILESFLNDSSITKIFHDAKRFYHLLSPHCSLNKNIWQAEDMQIISYVLNNGTHPHDLKSLIQTYFVLEEGLELKQWLAYCSMFMIQLYPQFKQRMAQEKLLILYERIEKPLSYVLFQMENNGIKIDSIKLREISDDFSKRASELERQIHQLADCKFNIGSPKQLGEVLFEKLKLKKEEKPSKNKDLSTNAEVLEELASQGHKIAQLVLSWRHLTKLNNTYANSLGTNVDNKNRIHTNFQMTVTSTGRLSSISPNLQNIPTKTEDGLKIRSAFIAENGYQLLSADYSQVELRLLASMSDTPTLKQAFIDNKDIHTITASEVFGVELKEVSSDMRRQAKAINFGIIYGQSAFGLANQLHISRTDANNYIQKYFEQYPGIKDYIEKTKEFAKQNGYVETLLGRKCYFKSINDGNPSIRNFSERAAINAPLQGSAADIIKKAMIQLAKEIDEQKLSAKILLQIHDELILEVKEEEIEIVSKLTKKVMESVAELDAPLKVDINFGKNWSQI